MTRYLLDTNALSEAPKPQPDSGFIAWLMTANDESLFTSCLSLGEIKKGIELVTGGARRKQLDGWLEKVVVDFGGRVVDVNQEVALLWGQLMAAAQQKGKPPPVIDTLIAAQCIHNQLTLITRNVKDFKQFAGLEVLCPWVDA